MRLFKFIETKVNALNVSKLPIFEIFRVSIWEGKKNFHEYNNEDQNFNQALNPMIF